MPEEINRILTDQISDLLFITEHNGGIVPEIRDGQVSTHVAAKIRG